MKQFVDFSIQIEGNKVFINREPKTPEERERFYAACVKVTSQMLDSMNRSVIEGGINENNN